MSRTVEPPPVLELAAAMEFFEPAIAAELANPPRIGWGPEIALVLVREVVESMDEDRALGSDVEVLVAQLLDNGRLLATLQAVV